MVFDPASLFKVVANGGPEAIFLLLVFMGLVITGVVRLSREVDAADNRWEEQKKLTEALLTRIDRQQDLFERSLNLVERQVMPLIESPPPQRRQRPWSGG